MFSDMIEYQDKSTRKEFRDITKRIVDEMDIRFKIQFDDVEAVTDTSGGDQVTWFA